MTTDALPISEEHFNTYDSKYYSSIQMNKDSTVRSEPLIWYDSLTESFPRNTTITINTVDINDYLYCLFQGF